MRIEKICTVCRDPRPLTEFSRDRSRSDGYAHRCKSCDKAKAWAWQRENPDRVSHTTKRRYWADPEHAREKNRSYRERNIERDRELRRQRNRRRRSAMRRGLDADDHDLTKSYRAAIANDPCFYCGKIRDHMEIDHYVAIGFGGRDEWFNLVRACHDCNSKKQWHCGTWKLLQTS